MHWPSSVSTAKVAAEVHQKQANIALDKLPCRMPNYLYMEGVNFPVYQTWCLTRSFMNGEIPFATSLGPFAWATYLGSIYYFWIGKESTKYVFCANLAIQMPFSTPRIIFLFLFMFIFVHVWIWMNQVIGFVLIQ